MKKTISLQLWAIDLIIWVFFVVLAFIIRSEVYHNFGFINNYWGDENTYLRHSNLFIKGIFPDSFFMPGWPYIMHLVRLFSFDATSIRIFNMFLSSLSCGFLYLLGKRLFGIKVGIIGGIIYAVNPEVIFYSHTYFSELIVEFLVILGTYLAFPTRSKVLGLFDYTVPFLLFGAGLTIKHFFVIPLAALFLANLIYSKRKPMAIGLMLASSFLPYAVYGTFLKSIGRDPMMILNSPMKNADEWMKLWPGGKKFESSEGRVRRFYEHVNEKLTRPLKKTYKSVRNTFFNLWSPGSFTVRRIYQNEYPVLLHKNIAAGFIISFYGLILIFGLCGYFFSAPDRFKLYSYLSLLILSLLPIIVFMVSRHRIPFVFHFILFGSLFLSRMSFWIKKLDLFSPVRLGALTAMILIVLAIFSDRVWILSRYQ